VAERRELPGWTALPRLAAWLCVPALLTGAGAATILAARLLGDHGEAAPGSLRAAAAAVTVVWTLPAFVLTPAAALLTLVIWRQRGWAPRVVSVLFALVIVSSVVLVPATLLALDNYVYFVPRPAEAPPARR
jgi:hypothetical protein